MRGRPRWARLERVTETTAGVAQRQRVAAYAVCVRAGRVLLARWVPLDGSPPRWTMPGGGIDHGEDPYDAVIREVREETGYEFRPTRLLGMDSLRLTDDDGAAFHGLRVVYTGEIVGGELRYEVGGSTDRAEWFDLDAVTELDRVGLVDTALALYRDRPATGSLTASV